MDNTYTISGIMCDCGAEFDNVYHNDKQLLSFFQQHLQSNHTVGIKKVIVEYDEELDMRN